MQYGQRMRWVLSVVGVLMATTLALGTVTWADPAGPGGREGMSHHRPGQWERGGWISRALRYEDQLGLSQDQVTKLRALRLESRKETLRRVADLRGAQLDLGALLHAETPDLAKIEAQVRRIESLRTDLRMSRIRTSLEARALLTLEQQKQLRALRSERPRGPHPESGGRHSRQGWQF